MKFFTIYFFLLSLVLFTSIASAQPKNRPNVELLGIANDNVVITDVELSNDGSLYISGTYSETFSVQGNQIIHEGAKDVFIMKLNSDNEYVWHYSKTDPALSLDITDILVNSEGLYATGAFDFVNGGLSFSLIKLNTDTGILKSQIDSKYAGNGQVSKGIRVMETANNNVIVAVYFENDFNVNVGSTGLALGDISPNGTAIDDFVLFKINESFNEDDLAWAQFGNLNENEDPESIKITTTATSLLTFVGYESEDSQFKFGKSTFGNFDKDRIIHLSRWKWLDTNQQSVLHKVFDDQSVNNLQGLSMEGANLNMFYNNFKRFESTGTLSGQDFYTYAGTEDLEVLDMDEGSSYLNVYVKYTGEKRLSSYHIAPVSDATIPNLYKLSFYKNGAILVDIDNLGEANTESSNIHFASNTSADKGNISVGNLQPGSTVNTNFDSETNNSGSTDFFINRQPEAYAEIVAPTEGETILQYAKTEVLVKGYDITNGEIGFKTVNNYNGTLTEKINIQDGNLDKDLFSKATFNNEDGTYLVGADLFIKSEAVQYKDTVTVNIQEAGQLTHTPSFALWQSMLAKRDSTKTYSFRNNSKTALTITESSLRNGTFFEANLNLPVTLQEDETFDYTITFSPDSAGLFNDTLDVVSTAGNNPYSVLVVGNGEAVTPNLLFLDSTNDQSPTSSPPFPFDGKKQLIGSSLTMPLYILNNGTDTLVIDNALFIENKVFKVDASVELPIKIPPIPEHSFEERVDSILITFTPNDYITFTDTLKFSSNDLNSSNTIGFNKKDGLVKIVMTADGYENIGLLTTPDTLKINALSENDSKEVSFVIKNEGETNLSINDLAYSGDYFSISGLTLNEETLIELTPNQTRTLRLVLAPKLYDLENDSVLIDSLTFTHNGYNGETKLILEVDVTKTRPVFQLNQTVSQSIFFDSGEGLTNEYVGEVPIQKLTTKSFQFTNTGNDTLRIERVVVSSLNDESTNDIPIGYYSISESSTSAPFELVPGESDIFTATFEVLKFEDFQVRYDIYHNSKVINTRSQNNGAYEDVENNGKYSHQYFGEGTTPNINAQLFEVLTDTIHPSFVNVLFQATTPQGVGITFLDQENPDVLINGSSKPNFFTLKEEGSEIKPNDAESDFQILKQDAIDFEFTTAIVLDKSASIGFENLPLIKDAARAMVQEIEDNQKIGIFTFSSQVQPIIDFTSDKTALINAINNIQLQGSSTNLYGGVITAADSLDNYTTLTLDKILKANIVVFTDGQENTGQYTIQQVQTATKDIDVYAVGVGDASISELEQITGFSGRVFLSNNLSQLKLEFQKIQREISKLANSFYWINYISPKRFGNNNITITVDGNLNSSVYKSINTSFSADGFDDVFAQVVINQNFPNVFGDDTVFVPENSQIRIDAATILNGKQPNYTWTSTDENIIKVLPDSPSGVDVILVPQGAKAQKTTITVVDNENRDLQGNLLEKTLVVVLGEPISNAALSFSVPAGTTGSFKLDENGSELNITENTGDSFNITIQKSLNPAGNIPEEIETIFEDTFYIIDLSTSGAVDIVYDLTFDISGISFSNESMATVLKREDSSSEWQNVKDIPNASVSIENGLLTASGLTSFSEFAIAEESEPTTVSNEPLGAVPTKFSLDQNYPNPFNPSTTIRFGLPNASEVNIEIYNMIGQKVMVLSNNRFGAGWHTISFNASGLSSGIYIYRIRAGNFIETKRMTLIK